MCDISIILPSYNGEKYLAEAIESVINQTFTRWELILVDDSSMDSTLEIMEHYAQLDNRIKIIHNERNLNLPNSLNVGFDNSNGTYLTWTSDDNIYDCTALSEMFDYLERHPNMRMVCADMRYIDSDGKFTRNAPIYDAEKFWYNNNVGACFMYRREVLECVGKYNNTLFGIEDYDYWIRVIKKFGFIHRIEKKLYSYRIHGGSLSNTRFFDIKKKLNGVRLANLDFICSQLHNESDLMGLYFDLLISEYEKDEFRERFGVKEIDFFREFDLENKKILIYGAGEYGRRAKEFLDGNILGYIDSNIEKVGTIYEGKMVYSIEQATEIFADCQIVVSVDAINLYSIAKQYSSRRDIAFTSFHQMARMILKNKQMF